MFYTADPQIKC